MGNAGLKTKKNLSESIRHRLKNLSEQRNRPFDEMLRYYAMERFLYRLSISPYSDSFFLKGGLMFKVWDALGHRATIDIDFLGKELMRIIDLKQIIIGVANISCEEDAISFNTEKLILRESQLTAKYTGISTSFSAKLFTTNIPILIDFGFNDIIYPKPQKIQYPTLLALPEPNILGYTPETVIAEKFEAIVSLSISNTRMKDFYDLWIILKTHNIQAEKLFITIQKVFKNRNTELKYPASFSSIFYDEPKTQTRWNKFIANLGKDPIELKRVILDLKAFFEDIFLNKKVLASK